MYNHRPLNWIYRHFFKRVFDVVLSFFALVILSPLLLILTVLGAFKMKGNPFFIQKRPGKKDKDGNERIFSLVKFRSMTCEVDQNGNLLPDGKRLTPYGKVLRSTSLDELPELINILKGDMSIVGPRPQLVKDLVFMTDAQRKRHLVKPGLSGLAQVNGRNAITWEEKLILDLQYLEKESFLLDTKLVLQTIGKVLNHSDISEEGLETAEDFGDYLLRTGKISPKKYAIKIQKVR